MSRKRHYLKKLLDRVSDKFLRRCQIAISWLQGFICLCVLYTIQWNISGISILRAMSLFTYQYWIPFQPFLPIDNRMHIPKNRMYLDYETTLLSLKCGVYPDFYSKKFKFISFRVGFRGSHRSLSALVTRSFVNVQSHYAYVTNLIECGFKIKKKHFTIVSQVQKIRDREDAEWTVGSGGSSRSGYPKLKYTRIYSSSYSAKSRSVFGLAHNENTKYPNDILYKYCMW